MQTIIKCPKCGKEGTLKGWKDGHGNSGENRMIYHKKKWNDKKPNRCYIDPLTSRNIVTEIKNKGQSQQRLIF